jgi:hypothetical protein
MQQNLATLWRRFGVFAAVGFVCVTSWLMAPPAWAANNPELLPNSPTAVVDLAKTFTNSQLERLDQELGQFENETGWKLRVLTQFDRTPGSAVKDFWQLDQNSVLVVADSRGGNILNFSVGDALYKYMPRTFWIELQTRFGNQFFVRDNGADEAIVQSLQSIQTCLRQDGCSVVPGLPQEQWILTLATSIVGGIIFGFASRPRKPGQFFAWQWALLFSPLWGMLFISFGLGPVLVRTSDWIPVFRNVSGFMIGALAAYLIPLFADATPSESEI